MLSPRQPPVQIELRVIVGDVLIRQMCRRIERHVGRGELLPAPRSLLPLLEASHRFFQPAQVHVEPDAWHVSPLLAAKQFPGPTQLQIAPADTVARSRISMMLEYLQTFLRLGID